ncbi:MAG: hypothetical protein AAF328_00350 [Planctomycetota bacterium]
MNLLETVLAELRSWAPRTTLQLKVCEVIGHSECYVTMRNADYATAVREHSAYEVISLARLLAQVWCAADRLAGGADDAQTWLGPWLGIDDLNAMSLAAVELDMIDPIQAEEDAIHCGELAQEGFVTLSGQREDIQSMARGGFPPQYAVLADGLMGWHFTAEQCRIWTAVLDSLKRQGTA